MRVQLIVLAVGIGLLGWGVVACKPQVSPQSAAAPTTQPKELTMDQLPKTEDEWRQKLTPEEYRVLRQKGTEAPFIGKYTDTTDAGTYYCAACGQELFKSDTKFHSECGWPAFYAAAAGDRVKLIQDHSYGMVRTEVECAHCGSHLGHIFDDAPDQPTGQRYCINSVSLKFVPAKSVAATAPTTAPTTNPGTTQK